MAVAFVKAATNSYMAGGSGPLTVTLNGVAAGNVLVVGVSLYEDPGDGLPVVSSSPALTYTNRAQSADVSASATASVRSTIFTSTATSAGNYIVTAALEGSAYGVATVAEFSGVDTAAPFDVGTSSTGTSAAATTGTTAATTVADAVAVACIVLDGGGVTISTPAGYTNAGANTPGVGHSLDYRALAATGTQSASWTLDSSIGWGGAIAVLKASGGAPAAAWSLVGLTTPGAAVANTAHVASGSVVLTEPAGSQSGDLLVAGIAARGNAAFTLPSGWSLVATQQASGNTSTTANASIGSGLMAWIVRGASAPALTFSRTAGDVGYGRVIAYRGATASPYDDGSAATLAANGTAATTPGFTTTAPDDLLVAMAAGADNVTFSAFDAATDPATASGATDTTTAPAAGAWIERADSGVNTGADTALAIADAVKSTAGATGTLQATASASSRHVVIVGAFKLEGAGGNATAPGYSPTVSASLAPQAPTGVRNAAPSAYDPTATATFGPVAPTAQAAATPAPAPFSVTAGFAPGAPAAVRNGTPAAAPLGATATIAPAVPTAVRVAAPVTAPLAATASFVPGAPSIQLVAAPAAAAHTATVGFSPVAPAPVRIATPAIANYTATSAFAPGVPATIRIATPAAAPLAATATFSPGGPSAQAVATPAAASLAATASLSANGPVAVRNAAPAAAILSATASFAALPANAGQNTTAPQASLGATAAFNTPAPATVRYAAAPVAGLSATASLFAPPAQAAVAGDATPTAAAFTVTVAHAGGVPVAIRVGTAPPAPFAATAAFAPSAPIALRSAAPAGASFTVAATFAAPPAGAADEALLDIGLAAITVSSGGHAAIAPMRAGRATLGFGA